MKLNGFVGTGSGKLGSSVWSTVAGQQVVRQYQPRVANPSTVAQVNQRARLKLASQLAAALAPVIAIPSNGMQSSRNLFIKKNMEQIIGNNGQAQIAYENIQLTNGNAALPSLDISRSQENGVVVKLSEGADAAVTRVVYILYKKDTEERLYYLGSTIQGTPGENSDFQAAFPYYEGELIVWAYGMKDMNSAATAIYGSYFAANGEDIAQLVMTRAIAAGDYQFTGTRGATLFYSESENITAGDGEFMVYLSASGPGSVSAPGFTNGRAAIERGHSVTATATPNENCQFVRWINRGTNAELSTSAVYTFTVNDMVDIVAVFNDPNSGGGGNTPGGDDH